MVNLLRGAINYLITSPTENNGKSFLSRSFATKLAEMGHKTLIDRQ